MTDFVKALLESTVADDNTNDDVTVEECLTPISTLIESAVADFDIAMTDATEVYEMACIVGGAKIVSENAGQSEAAALLEAASGNFFSKIADFFKMIGEKIAKLWKMLTDKIKSIGKDASKTYAKYADDAKKVFDKAKEDGAQIPLPGDNFKIINIDNGDKIFASIVEAQVDKFSNIDKVIEELNMGGDWNDEAFATVTGEKWTSQEWVLNDFFEIKGVKTFEELKKFVADAYGDVKNEGFLTDDVLAAFKATVELAASKNVAKAEKVCKMIKASANKLEKAAREFSKKAPDDNKAKEFFTASQAMMSAQTNVVMTIINTRAAIIINAASAYANFIKGVATGKITPVSGKAKQQAATDGVDYSVFFEGYDIVEEGCNGEDCDSEDEEDNDVEEGCKKSSMESCSILDIAKMLL